MIKVYVPDTLAIISYYSEVFEQPSIISAKTLNILDVAIKDLSPFIKLSIPSVVFIELFDKWLKTEEFVKKFFFEVFTEIKESPNVEIRELDREILEQLVTIGGNLHKHEIHDKLILASAMTLNAPLITTDPEIIKFAETTNNIPFILN